MIQVDRNSTFSLPAENPRRYRITPFFSGAPTTLSQMKTPQNPERLADWRAPFQNRKWPAKDHERLPSRGWGVGARERGKLYGCEWNTLEWKKDWISKRRFRNERVDWISCRVKCGLGVERRGGKLTELVHLKEFSFTRIGFRFLEWCRLERSGLAQRNDLSAPRSSTANLS